MKVVKAVLVGVAAVAGVLAIVGLLLPDRLQAARSIEIAASPQQVFGYVSGFGRFNDWSPWAGLDPAALYTLSGPPHGRGARLEWRSRLPRVGAGSQEVVVAEPPHVVVVRLRFDDQDEARSTMRLEESNGGTRATWRFEMNLGMNPLKRWIALLVDARIGADYELGLARLKALVEAEAAAAASPAASDAAEPTASAPPAN